MGVKASGSVLSKTPYRLYLRFEGDLPKTANNLLGAHWRTRAGNADKWKRIVAMSSEALRPEKALGQFHISVKRSSHRMLDFDGCVSIFKPIIDGLKGLIIEDDCWKMTGPWRVDQEFRPKKDGPLIEVWISEKENLGTPN
jgi:hypothetical protein